MVGWVFAWVLSDLSGSIDGALPRGGIGDWAAHCLIYRPFPRSFSLGILVCRPRFPAYVSHSLLRFFFLYRFSFHSEGTWSMSPCFSPRIFSLFVLGVFFLFSFSTFVPICGPSQAAVSPCSNCPPCFLCLWSRRVFLLFGVSSSFLWWLFGSCYLFLFSYFFFFAELCRSFALPFVALPVFFPFSLFFSSTPYLFGYVRFWSVIFLSKEDLFFCFFWSSVPPPTLFSNLHSFFCTFSFFLFLFVPRLFALFFFLALLTFWAPYSVPMLWCCLILSFHCNLFYYVCKPLIFHAFLYAVFSILCFFVSEPRESPPPPPSPFFWFFCLLFLKSRMSFFFLASFFVFLVFIVPSRFFRIV